MSQRLTTAARSDWKAGNAAQTLAGSKRATEEMSVVLGKDGLWRVAGYYIR